jgi:hypothetical protein
MYVFRVQLRVEAVFSYVLNLEQGVKRVYMLRRVVTTNHNFSIIACSSRVQLRC